VITYDHIPGTKFANCRCSLFTLTPESGLKSDIGPRPFRGNTGSRGHSTDCTAIPRREGVERVNRLLSDYGGRRNFPDLNSCGQAYLDPSLRC
jgi:hypothetical protein